MRVSPRHTARRSHARGLQLCSSPSEVRDSSRTTTVLAPFVTAAVCVDCMAFAQQITFAIKFCCWSSGRPTTRLRRQRTATWAKTKVVSSFARHLHRPRMTLREVRTRLRESRRAMTRRSHCDIVWHPAWRAKAQYERKSDRRGSKSTLRLSRNAKNEQQSGSHNTSATAAI